MDPFPTTILLATDSSEEAGLAAQMAASITKRTGSELHIIHVVDLGVVANPRLQTGLQQRARELLHDQVRKTRESWDTTATAHLATGQPDQEILALAEKVGAGLIVVGSRGLGGVSRALMGSVSDSVVRHAHCPVLVVRQ
jgi:nucleotide-binding universal stress UspA family protein